MILRKDRDDRFELTNPFNIMSTRFDLLRFVDAPTLNELVTKVGEQELRACFPRYKIRSEEFDEQKRAAQIKQEVERVIREEEEARPQNLLRKSYSAYLKVRACHEDRCDYIAVYISDTAIEEALVVMRRIEHGLKSYDKELALVAVWKEVSEEDHSSIAFPANDFESQRALCQMYLKSLAGLDRSINGPRPIEKDF